MLALFFFFVLLQNDVKSGTYMNPIVPQGADPWVIQHDSFYYYCFSSGSAISIKKSQKLQDISSGQEFLVFQPPAGQPYSQELWAPELHFLKDKWYIYFAADDGHNENHRMFVLEALYPEGPYQLKGKIASNTDKWAIDGTVLQKPDGSLFFIWSGWEGDTNIRQVLYISEMESPWKLKTDRVMISQPEYSWEQNTQPFVPKGINEGPEVFQTEAGIFVIYSASGSWGDDYCLGLLEAVNTDLMKPSSWRKYTEPVFSKAEQAYGPGHASFTKSPDGKEDWMVYHANIDSNGGWENRSVRMQKITGISIPLSLGIPEPCFQPFEEPSGSDSSISYNAFLN